MQTERNLFIYRSIEYLVWFLIFMLIESFVNTRVGEVIGSDKVELFYGIFIIFTAVGFLSCGTFVTKEISQHRSIVSIILCMVAVGMFSLVNISGIVIVGSVCSLFLIGFLGGRIMHKLAFYISSCKKAGTILGTTMAVSIFIQFIIQTVITTRLPLIICYELLLVVILVFELRIQSGSFLTIRKDGNENAGKEAKSQLWVYIIATLIMTVILSLNDAYLVDLSAHTSTVNLFSWVRLFYCLSLVLAGVIYDYKNANYFNIVVACAMMLSTIAYAFLGNTSDFNIDMSIMYFYCGFYVMFLTIHFIKQASLGGNESRQFIVPGLGRVTRCLTTALVTFIMIAFGNAVSVQTMIIISSIMSIILMLFLASNDILIVREAEKRLEESLSIVESKEPIQLVKDSWNIFIENYGFTNRECDVLEKLIQTEDDLQEIADALYISKRVVQRHITAIYEKTGRTTRIGLLQLYVEFINDNMKKMQ